MRLQTNNVSLNPAQMKKYGLAVVLFLLFCAPAFAQLGSRLYRYNKDKERKMDVLFNNRGIEAVIVHKKHLEKDKTYIYYDFRGESFKTQEHKGFAIGERAKPVLNSDKIIFSDYNKNFFLIDLYNPANIHKFSSSQYASNRKHVVAPNEKFVATPFEVIDYWANKTIPLKNNMSQTEMETKNYLTEQLSITADGKYIYHKYYKKIGKYKEELMDATTGAQVDFDEVPPLMEEYTFAKPSVGSRVWKGNGYWVELSSYKLTAYAGNYPNKDDVVKISSKQVGDVWLSTDADALVWTEQDINNPQYATLRFINDLKSIVMRNSLCLSGNCMDGTGKLSLGSSNHYYEGGFKSGKYHGKGKIYTQDKITEGSYDEGKEHGLFTTTNSSGSLIHKKVYNDGEYIGECLSGSCFEGKGKIKRDDGTYIEGSFRKGLPYHDQYYVTTDRQGTISEGYVLGSDPAKPTGMYKITEQGKKPYYIYYKDGLRQISGVCISNDCLNGVVTIKHHYGTMVAALDAKRQFTGEGVYTQKNGSETMKFEGTFERGFPRTGKLYLNGNLSYEGEVNPHFQAHGKGTAYTNTGGVEPGYFDKGKFIGRELVSFNTEPQLSTSTFYQKFNRSYDAATKAKLDRVLKGLKSSYDKARHGGNLLNKVDRGISAKDDLMIYANLKFFRDHIFTLRQELKDLAYLLEELRTSSSLNEEEKQKIVFLGNHVVANMNAVNAAYGKCPSNQALSENWSFSDAQRTVDAIWFSWEKFSHGYE